MSKSDTNEWLKEVVELSMLYDFYGELLSESQQAVFEGYVLDDMTLAEISNEAGVSRQGVYDSLKRTVSKLKNYENKLHLVEKFNSMKDEVSNIKRIALEVKSGDVEKTDEIIRISQGMLDNF